MSLITFDELARGACIGVFGGLAGVCTLTFPGSPLWLLPAGVAVGGAALTVPEVRSELVRALPYLAQGAQQARAALPSLAQALPARAAPPRGTATAAPSEPTKEALRPRQWLHAVNDKPNDNPHMTVVGPSGSGKTTFVSAALSKRAGRVVVLTPKVTPGAWRGAEVVTLSDDLTYEPLAQALADLQTEARRRSVALRQGEALEPLTVVLDELPELHEEIKGAGKFAVRLSRWGRELNMRQVVIATKDEALNIPGWAATRPNYVRVELGKPTEGGARPAWLDDGQSRRQIDLSSVQIGAERAQLRPWRSSTGETSPVRPPAETAAPARSASADPTLAALLSETVPSASERARDGQTTAAVSLRPYVPTEGEGHRDTQSGTLVLPRDGGDLHLHLYATAEAHAPAPGASPEPAEAPARPAKTWRRRGPAVHRQKPVSGSQDRADELHRRYRECGAAGEPYRPLYRQLGGSKDTTLAAWQEGRALRQGRSNETH